MFMDTYLGEETKGKKQKSDYFSSHYHGYLKLEALVFGERNEGAKRRYGSSVPLPRTPCISSSGCSFVPCIVSVMDWQAECFPGFCQPLQQIKRTEGGGGQNLQSVASGSQACYQPGTHWPLASGLGHRIVSQNQTLNLWHLMLPPGRQCQTCFVWCSPQPTLELGLGNPKRIDFIRSRRTQL